MSYPHIQKQLSPGKTEMIDYPAIEGYIYVFVWRIGLQEYTPKC